MKFMNRASAPVVAPEYVERVVEQTQPGDTVWLPPLAYEDLPANGFDLVNRDQITLRGGPVYGSIPVSGWIQCYEALDSITELIPSEHVENVWRGEVTLEGFDLGTFTSFASTRHLDHAQTVVSRPSELVVNSIVQDLSRYPVNDYFDEGTYTKPATTSFLVVSSEAAEHIPSVVTLMIVTGRLNGGHSYYMQGVPASYDDINEKFTFSGNLRLGAQLTNPTMFYRFENAPEFMTEEGFHFIDLAEGYVYWYPPASANPNSQETVLTYKSNGPMFTLDDCTSCNVDVSMGNSRHAGSYISGGSENSVAGASYSNLGLWGVRIEPTPGNEVGKHQVVGCAFTDIGDACVSMMLGRRNTADHPTAGEGLIENCTMRRPARIFNTYRGGILMGICGNTVRHVCIDDCWGGAVHHRGEVVSLENEEYYSVNDLVYDGLYVTNACKHVVDAGCLYIWRGFTSRGNVVRNSSFSWAPSDAMEDELRVGCYFDGADGWSVENCTFDAVNGMGVLSNGGRAIRVIESIFRNSLNVGIRIDESVYLEPIFAIQDWSSKSQTFDVTVEAEDSDEDLFVDGPINEEKANYWLSIVGESSIFFKPVLSYTTSSPYKYNFASELGQVVPVQSNAVKTNGSNFYPKGYGDLLHVIDFYQGWDEWVPPLYVGNPWYDDLADLDSLPTDDYGKPLPALIENNVFYTEGNFASSDDYLQLIPDTLPITNDTPTCIDPEGDTVDCY